MSKIPEKLGFGQLFNGCNETDTNVQSLRPAAIWRSFLQLTLAFGYLSGKRLSKWSSSKRIIIYGLRSHIKNYNMLKVLAMLKHQTATLIIKQGRSERV